MTTTADLGPYYGKRISRLLEFRTRGGGISKRSATSWAKEWERFFADSPPPSPTSPPLGSWPHNCDKCGGAFHGLVPATVRDTLDRCQKELASRPQGANHPTSITVPLTGMACDVTSLRLIVRWTADVPSVVLSEFTK